jgi:selenocysteine-specific elongation factor
VTHRHFILATAGHVDHGKSVLVEALTGTHPDRLPEEKARGITIDLGFAQLELPVPGPLPSVLRLGLVDVPGHEDFVKNMVAGVGSIDLALLVVAADDGWMPQTEEHLQILTYLGVTRAVVALTKTDLAQDEPAAVSAVRARLQASPFSNAPIVPTSVVTRRGLEELRAALIQVLAETPPPRDLGKPRLSVDRVFILHGIGTVATGTLTGGTLKRGQAVAVQPRGQLTRIRSLQSHNRDVEAAGPGTRTALNLADVDAGSGVQRGDVITLPDLGAAADTLDVLLEKSARLADAKSAAARPLKDGTRVSVHFGSAHAAARLVLLGQDKLNPGQRVLAQVRLASPLFAFAGDRLIVRDGSEQATLAGGVILDPAAHRRRTHAPERRAFLEERTQGLERAEFFVRSQLARDGVARRTRLLDRSRFSATEIAEAVDQLAGKKRLVPVGEFLADAAWWDRLQQRAGAAIDAWHRAHPEQPGLPLSELRAALHDALPFPEVFEALTAQLTQGGFNQAGVAIRRAHHRPALPPQLQAAGTRLRAALAAKPLEPPSRKELAPDNASQQALRFLIQTDAAVELSEDVILAAEAFTRATDLVKQHLTTQGQATTSELRQVLGSNRRIVIPLLERLDKLGVTRRDGDVRVLRQR